MHGSVMAFVAEVLPPQSLAGLRVLEVGSYDVNGSVREIVQPHCSYYVGCDIRPGGVLVLTMRGPGANRHDHPEDHWRYTPELLTTSLARLGMAGIPRRDPGLGYDDGVFYVGVRRDVRDDDLADLAAEPAPVS